MSSRCPEHGIEEVHKMTFNKRTEFDYTAFFFSCGRFIRGSIKDRHYEDPDEFLKATEEYLKELHIREKEEEERKLYKRFGVEDSTLWRRT